MINLFSVYKMQQIRNDKSVLGIFCQQISLVFFVNRLKIRGVEKRWGALIRVPSFLLCVLHCVLMCGFSGRLKRRN